MTTNTLSSIWSQVSITENRISRQFVSPPICINVLVLSCQFACCTFIFTNPIMEMIVVLLLLLLLTFAANGNGNSNCKRQFIQHNFTVLVNGATHKGFTPFFLSDWSRVHTSTPEQDHPYRDNGHGRQ
ncbi:hypothetical protein RDWZM_005464 [Blomia tropicalis]|uniref:Uncharacterized protein n=1 Tax=Blomia tropicalis TaxID=40697 RepID=A0A9Q0M665_BLOTA|nr:hypothetical protein RDWZM_005464 [Blomia tropicalis]